MSGLAQRVHFLPTAIPHAQIVDGLKSPGSFRNPGPVQSVEMAGSFLSDVYLTWDDETKSEGHAYKLRHDMTDEDLFLDYSDRTKRLEYGLDEIRRNSRNAPGVYLGMRGVFQDPADGRIFIDRSRTDLDGALDAVLAMRRLPKDANLNVKIKAGFDVDPHIDQLAKAIADMHGRADVIGQTQTPEMVDSFIQHQLATARQADAYIRRVLPEYRSSMEEVFTRALQDIKPQLLARCAAGKFRECHGDLWSMNVWQHGGEFLLIDANEYNPGITENDILWDVAFLGIDFMSFDKNDTANRLFDAYMRQTDDHADAKLYDVFLGLSWLFIVKVYFKFFERSGNTDAHCYKEGFNSLMKLENRLARYFWNGAI